jgi:hypothetical protein
VVAAEVAGAVVVDAAVAVAAVAVVAASDRAARHGVTAASADAATPLDSVSTMRILIGRLDKRPGHFFVFFDKTLARPA